MHFLDVYFVVGSVSSSSPSDKYLKRLTIPSFQVLLTPLTACISYSHQHVPRNICNCVIEDIHIHCLLVCCNCTKTRSSIDVCLNILTYDFYVFCLYYCVTHFCLFSFTVCVCHTELKDLYCIVL